MRNKDVRELAGIGRFYGQRLKTKGFGKARSVLGQYLVLNGDDFMDWLGGACYATPKQQRDCLECLKEWCEQHL